MANDTDTGSSAIDGELRGRTRDIERLLGRQLRRIRTRFLIHGVGWIAAAILALTTVAFLVDLSLRLPAPVRVLLTLAAVGYLAFGVRRRLLGPLGVRVAEKDVALALENRFPGLRQELVTAVELGSELVQRGPAALRGQSASMVVKIVEGAQERARALPLDAVLSARRTVRVWAIATLVAGIAAVTILPRIESFGVFLRRALGLNVEYPRRTHLHIELPQQDREFRIETRDGEAVVTLAAGADLPILVRVEGDAPREAFLIVEGGRGLPGSIAMSQRTDERFRHVFRRVQSGFSFFARGGDDDRGDLVVRVQSIEPPLVEGVEATLTFPAYTGMPAQTQKTGAIEALIGTEVRIDITTTSPVTSGSLHLVQAGQDIALVASSVEDDSGAGRRLTCSFTVVGSDQYEVHLLGTEGISNPRPASYPVLALEDHAPSGRIFEPGADDVQVVLPTALIPLRVLVEDDFGIALAELATAIGGSDKVSRRALLTATETDKPRDRLIVELLSVASFAAAGAPPQQGDAIALEIGITDNRVPEAGHTDLARRTVHVVDEIELMRRLSAHFRRVRDDVETALVVQTERRDALEGFLENLSDPSAGARDPQLVTLEVGQGRVLSAARRVRDGLDRAYDVSLFNGLEGGDSPHAKAAVEFWLRYQREADLRAERAPGFYRALGEEQRAGRIGKMEKMLDPLLDMALRIDRVVDQMAEPILHQLEQASIAGDKAQLRVALESVRALQVQAVTELETLLGRLDQWNEFQDVVQSARALRDAQRDVEYRTRARNGGGK